MQLIEIARKYAELNQLQQAQNSYRLCLETSEITIEERFEASIYLLYTNYNKQIVFSQLVYIYNQGYFQMEIYDELMKHAFLPYANEIQELYQKNVKALKKYPYIFKKQFFEYDKLTKTFFKYSDEGYLILEDNQFKFIGVNMEKIDRYFFQDLSKPIYTENLYSNYQLEYLNDNVRESEWCAKENHIYLYYDSFEEFCNYLQIININTLLKNEKFVFLFEDEKTMYPIDFKEKYGKDYSKFEPKNFNVKEFNKLIYGHQISTHNGGDFFNEIMDGHPNVISTTSLLYDEVMEHYNIFKKENKFKTRKHIEKDSFLNFLFIKNLVYYNDLDPRARIVPALYVQPHFYKPLYSVECKGKLGILECDDLNVLYYSSPLSDFKYITGFAPLRRATNSYAATVRFKLDPYFNKDKVLGNALGERFMSQGFYCANSNRFLKNVCVVRFEDGKLNPKATFTALAEHLDIPYSKSMEQCTQDGVLNPESLKGNTIGFDTSSVYKTYDEFAGEAERILIEYTMRESMKYYGYDFKYWDGHDLKDEEIDELVDACSVFKALRINNYKELIANGVLNIEEYGFTMEEIDKCIEYLLNNTFDMDSENKKVLKGLKKIESYIDEKEIRQELMPLLKPKEELIEVPLYR